MKYILYLLVITCMISGIANLTNGQHLGALTNFLLAAANLMLSRSFRY